MKLLNKHTDYAIRALLVLAQHPQEFISARDIAKEEKIPYPFMRKILSVLIKNKLVVSREGGKGGVQLVGNPAKIKVSDVIRIFQGEIKLSECMFRRKLCHHRSSCVLRKNIMRIESLVTKEFKGITIASLLKELMG